MNNQPLEYKATLTRMPNPHKPSLAQSQMLPLLTDNDFEVFSEFSSSHHPVLLNVAEHYQLLSALVDSANQQWPNITIMIRLSMPGGMRIPANLLADNVLLLEDITDEEQKLKLELEHQLESNQQAVTGLLVIEDRFRRIEIDNNDNAISLRLYHTFNNTLNDSLNSTSNSTLSDNALQPLIEQLNNWGVVANQ